MGLSKSRRELKHQELRLIDSSGDELLLKVKPGKTLLENAVDNSVDMPRSCGGMGSCGTCRVRLTVKQGPVPEHGDVEKEIAQEKGYSHDERLSCQIEIPDEEFSWTAELLGSHDEEW